jgi:hypothetical protein
VNGRSCSRRALSRLEPYAPKGARTVPRGEGGRKAILLPDWIKCLLKCRHWLAESQAGVSLQLYLALIAAVLLQLCLGRRPNKRMFELIQLYQMGYATTEEVIAGLKREQAREQSRQKIAGQR